MNHIPEEIFDLVSTKSFQELSEAERSLVVSVWDQESYESNFELLKNFTEENDAIIAYSRNKLFQPYTPSKSNESSFTRKSVYSVALMMLLVGTLAFYLGFKMGQHYARAGEVEMYAAGNNILEDSYPEELVFMK